MSSSKNEKVSDVSQLWKLPLDKIHLCVRIPSPERAYWRNLTWITTKVMFPGLQSIETFQGQLNSWLLEEGPQLNAKANYKYSSTTKFWHNTCQVQAGVWHSWIWCCSLSLRTQYAKVTVSLHEFASGKRRGESGKGSSRHSNERIPTEVPDKHRDTAWPSYQFHSNISQTLLNTW
jgi:hypothetical protein